MPPTPNAVPWWQRALAVTASPLVGLHRLAFGSRRALARHLELTDMDWHDEFVNVDSMDELLALLGEQRDKLLITQMDEIHRNGSTRRSRLRWCTALTTLPPWSTPCAPCTATTCAAPSG